MAGAGDRADDARPESVANTLNAYLAFRAVLLACKGASISVRRISKITV